MKTFETFEKVSGMSKCRKKPLYIYAKQMREEFRVDSIEGNYIQGKVDDYLLQGIKGELYVCDKDIFEKSYVFVKKHTNGLRIKEVKNDVLL